MSAEQKISQLIRPSRHTKPCIPTKSATSFRMTTGLNQNNQQQEIDMESICNWVVEHFYLQTSKMLKTLHNECVIIIDHYSCQS